MSLTTIDHNNIFQKEVIGHVRTAQEDSHDMAALTPNGDVFVVCDGMGGHVGGKQASSIAVKSILEYLKREKYLRPMQALQDALQFANMQILGYANEHPELKGMGTTACIVLLQDSEAYIAHVGDSRIYLYLGKEKQLHRITKDHSFVQTLVDAGQITDEEAEHHPNKNRILKALGIQSDLSPSVGRVRPKNGDVFLICSDGLSGMISDSTMREVLSRNTSLGDKGETLVDLALAAGGLDNITLELIRIANSPHSRSVFRSYNPSVRGRGPKRGRPQIMKRLAIAVSVLAACAVIGGVIYRIVDEQQEITALENELEALNKEIPADSVTLSKAIKDFERDSSACEGLKNKTQEAYKFWNGNRTEDNKRAYESQKNATDRRLKELEVKKDTIDKIRNDLSKNRARRDSLEIKLSKKQK